MEEISLRERIISSLKKRRDNVLSGNINCLPLPFTRFRRDFPGIEQGSYYLVSGATKSAKTQLTNYLFIYNTILYCYNNPNKLVPKIFYFPLEETAETITLRFMAYLINYLSKGEIRISPTNLKSTDERFPVSEEILTFMERQDFKDIMKLYEDTVTFYDDRNPTGINKVVRNYAETHGTTYYKTIKVKEKDDWNNIKEVERQLFDYYVPNNTNEYVIIIVDHVSLLNTEKDLNLRESINKLSGYMVLLRNRYNYIPVIVQQQSTETQSLDAFKSSKIRPTVPGLADSKYTARDCNVMLGITNPHIHELTEYLKYDITKFKGNIRFVEVVINRNGNANSICPLFFDGAINSFNELPLPTDVSALTSIYKYIDTKIRNTFAMVTFSNRYTNKSNKNSKFANLFIKFKQWLMQ